MNVIYLMIFFSLLLSLTFLGAFIWASTSGQFDDLDTPQRKAILDTNKKGNTNGQSEQNSD